MPGLCRIRHGRLIIAFDEAPAEFSLVSPEEEMMFQVYSATFTWNSTTDPDYEDTVSYSLYLSSDSAFTDPVEIDAGADTTVEVNELVENMNYWWRVHAQDTNTQGTWSTETWTFSVNAIHAPSNLQAALDSLNGTVVLEWEHNQPGNLNDFTEFKIYRDDVELATIEDITYTDQLEDAGTYIYTVSAMYDEGESELTNPVEVTWDGFNSVETNLADIPTRWEIESLYPNPFNPVLNVRIALPATSHLKVIIYDVSGREVMRLADGNFKPGYKDFSFDGSSISSGVYFVHAGVSNKMNEMKKVVLVK